MKQNFTIHIYLHEFIKGEHGLLKESALTVSTFSPIASNNSYVASDETIDIICTV